MMDTSNFFNSSIPGTRETLYESIYAGSVYLLPPSAASLALCDECNKLMQRAFGDSDLRRAHERFGPEELFDKVKNLRKEIFEGSKFLSLTRDLISEIGLAGDPISFDPMRFRAVIASGWLNPRAAAAYLAHRDTWYSHSYSEINWWIPMHDVESMDTFSFYPEFFATVVPNNSEVFDHARWTAKGDGLRIGWQNFNAGLEAVYPGQTADIPIRQIERFSAVAGSRLLFSGAHLHQTNRERCDLTRFSIDFRMVNREHHEIHRGAPNVDGRSTGDAVPDFLPLNR